MTNVNSYDEYGVPAAGNVGRFQYTGQKWIAEAGLYDYKARMYHPSLGRFMQTDPIGYASGMNLYAYVRGDPVNLLDPAGTQDRNMGPNWYVKPIEIPGGTVTGDRGSVIVCNTGDRLSVISPGGPVSGPREGGGGGGPAPDPCAGVLPEHCAVVTGKRYRQVVTLPNTDGTFSCSFVGGAQVTVTFTNRGFTNRADVTLISYPATAAGDAIPQWSNPGSTAFYERHSTYVFHFMQYPIDFTARQPSASGLYRHTAIGRIWEREVSEIAQFFNVKIETAGGFGGCR